MIQRDAVEDYLGSSGIGGHQFEKWSRDPTSINDLGVVLSKIPVSPKYAKMILASHKYEGLFIYAVMIVACMSVPEIYTSTSTSPQAEAQLVMSDNEDQEAGEDKALITSIDVHNREAKQQSFKRLQRD